MKPTFNNLLVEPKEIRKSTSGGLLLPDDVLEKDGFSRQEGIILSMGPTAFVDDFWTDGWKPKVGDRVMFAKYNASQIDEGRWIMKDTAVLAVMDGND